MMKQEIDIMKSLKHDHIIELIEVFEDPLDLYLVMEVDVRDVGPEWQGY